MPPLPNEVFLSHSNLDRTFATSIADLLRRHRIPVWYSRTDIIGAQQWHDEIGSALKRCDWFVVILSPNSVNSGWVKRELLFSLKDHRYAERIVPVLHQRCDYDELSWTLSLLQIVDFTEGFENGCRSLLRVWGLGLQTTIQE
jgi:hypothetical protein